ncbi:MAG TPA: NTP transferase domain-containing protein [Puia sp.]|nr:NTP transferase domain-containing protein [Puia sp.]
MSTENKQHTGVPIKGLVLAGGRSTRMGRDKTGIAWHGVEQVYYAANLLKPFCSEVFISRRQALPSDLEGPYSVITDVYTGIGPYGAILSAFALDPDTAWLVLASDLPLIDGNSLAYLVKNRNSSRLATTFRSPHDGLPEPLITIWEPRSRGILLEYLSQGITCPRKALIKSNDAEILLPPDPEALMNVNTPEDLQKAEALIARRRVSNHPS